MAEQQAIAESLYWLLSTVAQTLGGAMALLGTFVLYRLSLLERDAGALERDFLNLIAQNEEAQAVYNALADEEETERLETVLNEYYLDRCDPGALKGLKQERGRILRRFGLALGSTAAVIVGSLILLPLCTTAATVPVFAGVVTWTVVGASVWCVLLYVALVWGVIAQRRNSGRARSSKSP